MNHQAFPPRGSSFSPPRPLRSQGPLPPSKLQPAPFSPPSQADSPIRRKPLPSTSLPSAFSSPTLASRLEPEKLQGTSRKRADTLPSKDSDDGGLAVRNLDEFPHGSSPLFQQGHFGPQDSVPADPFPPPHASDLIDGSPPPKRVKEECRPSKHSRLTSEPHASSPPQCEQRQVVRRSRSNTMGLIPPSNKPPPLRMDSFPRSTSQPLNDNKKPQTPGSKIGQFFSWKKQSESPDTDSSATEPSDQGRSPLPSPLIPSPQTSAYSSRSYPPMDQFPKVETTSIPNGQFGGPLVQHQKSDSSMSTKVGQLEGELREISSELAGSIRREMELEDLVEQLQAEVARGPDANRTSDYFSDAGTGSLRPLGDGRNKDIDIDKVKRESEQLRAQLKVDISNKWQDERSRRKELELHIQILEDQVSQLRQGQTEKSELSTRAKELDVSLDDTKRRLAEERKLKENFEDLLTALKVDLQQHRNERDVLKAQLGVPEGFDFQRMQQEIKSLKQENAAHAAARKMNQEIPRFTSISEEGEDTPRRVSLTTRGAAGLSRSNSIAQIGPRSPNFVPGGLARSGSLSRSNSITGRNLAEQRESLADRMKDVELQRDTLHSAVKALLLRQEHQAREHKKQVALLEVERDRALQASTSRKAGYEGEVRGLRGEINFLRERASEALQQKLETEKGLGGLKMDLDRNRQETNGLKKLLNKRDSSLPEHMSAALQQAYNQLQNDRRVAESPRNSVRSLAEEQRLAEQLKQSAQRSESLAAQVRLQLDTNASLRDRLADAVGRGEKYQQASTSKITELQSQLRRLEDTVTLAQQQSETAVMKHEEEIRILTASHNAQLLRIKSGPRSSQLFNSARASRMSKSPLSPMFNGGKSPRLDKTSSGPGMALSHALKTEQLEAKVGELEQALSQADQEMQQVVQRMNTAQIEVADLQTQKDEALRETRKLQAAIMAEREKVQSLMSPGGRI